MTILLFVLITAIAEDNNCKMKRETGHYSRKLLCLRVSALILAQAAISAWLMADFL